MLRFDKAKVLPVFLRRREPVKTLADRAKVNPKTAWRAVNGLPVSAAVVDKLSHALELGDTLKFLSADV